MVVFLLKKYWDDTAAKQQRAPRWYAKARPWPTELWLLPTAERFIPGSCPKYNIWNNILPNLLAPLIWRGKQSLCFPAEKACKEENNLCILPDRSDRANSSDKSLPGRETCTINPINHLLNLPDSQEHNFHLHYHRLTKILLLLSKALCLKSIAKKYGRASALED